MFERLSWGHRARRVLSMLAEERGLLQSARLADLVSLSQKRDRLVDDLASRPGRSDEDTIAMLERIRSEARRNQRLIEAFRKGVEDARTQLERIEKSTTEIGLYSSSGSRLPDPPTRARSDRRA
ncbi:hypothetical protein FDP22_23140 (plasmid) [Paroceanicella profunda]|uniref:Flagellar protein FlgN n=1 Tax=Paroceanicella profunda TaxID=2579971 RepID=A0A5B8G444_9RHOB|nr:hypothetical protein [Paroceanicella profunda]QDL94770.1 hypothetical protein FDP22_23140 [Paroceanicella profunda]